MGLTQVITSSCLGQSYHMARNTHTIHIVCKLLTSSSVRKVRKRLCSSVVFFSIKLSASSSSRYYPVEHNAYARRLK